MIVLSISNFSPPPQLISLGGFCKSQRDSFSTGDKNHPPLGGSSGSRMTLSENVLEKPAELMLDHRFPDQKPGHSPKSQSPGDTP